MITRFDSASFLFYQGVVAAFSAQTKTAAAIVWQPVVMDFGLRRLPQMILGFYGGMRAN